MPDIAPKPILHVEEQSAYASALCSTCKWKLSACDDPDTPLRIRLSPEQIRTRAYEHSISEGHHVSMIATTHITFDYRVP